MFWITSPLLQWSDGAGLVAPVTTPSGADAWPGDYREPRKDRKRPELLDKVELREMLEDAFEGKKPEPVIEVLLEHKLPKDAPRQAFGVDWDALLNDLAACENALRAHEQRVEKSRAADAEQRAAQIATMVELLEAEQREQARQVRRAKLRRVAARLILEDDD